MDSYEYCMIGTQGGGSGGGSQVWRGLEVGQLRASYRTTHLLLQRWKVEGCSLQEGPDIISFRAPFYSSFDSHSSPRLTDTTVAGMDVQKRNGSVEKKKKMGKCEGGQRRLRLQCFLTEAARPDASGAAQNRALS